MIFPTTTVCSSFYRELRSPHFPNRYAAYLDGVGIADARKGLELRGILRKGVVHPAYLDRPNLPSAPLRAFSYTQAGGAQSCGKHVNAVFKCPDGYAGEWPRRLQRDGGYADFSNPECNPLSNKIVLMDEVRRLHARSRARTRLPAGAHACTHARTRCTTLYGRAMRSFARQGMHTPQAMQAAPRSELLQPTA